MGKLFPDDEHRRGDVRVYDSQGNGGGLHGLDRILNGVRAPTDRSAGGIVQLARGIGQELGSLGDTGCSSGGQQLHTLINDIWRSEERQGLTERVCPTRVYQK
ncbi:hypothetical protein AB0O64_23565 [Streptomyces sp. NPDC088341]|uniref:hypothetical protein n=1 Tax=Streptomyces sp. NPDC088341 TaxID=3154870 RepID=UPI00342D5032